MQYVRGFDDALERERRRKANEERLAEQRARERLEKAAPDLLAACKKAQRFIDDLEANYCPNIIEPNSNSGLDWDTRYILQDAIAKAKV